MTLNSEQFPLTKHRLKSKLFKRIGISAGILVVLWFFLRITGMVQFYNIPTDGNSPCINYGDRIFATNLKSYERLDFVCYNFSDPRFPPTSIWVRRICGLPGDTVQLIDGALFVNGKNIDSYISTKHNYIVDQATSNKLKNDRNWPLFDNETGLIQLPIDDKVANSQTNAKRFIDNKRGVVHKSFNQSWTMDNFGPLVVPKGQLFLLGDNRHNTVDSRHTGLTAEEDVVGVVVH